MNPAAVIILIFYVFPAISIISVLLASLFSTKVSKRIGVCDWDDFSLCFLVAIIPIANILMIVHEIPKVTFTPRGWRR